MILHPRTRVREIKTFSNELRTLAAANRLESMPMGEIRAKQDRMLRMAVENAYRQVPHYKEAFRAARISPGDVRTVNDLHKLPMLTREEFLAGFPDRIMSRSFHIEDTFHSESSGTSGMRCRYLTDWPTRDANFALLYRARSLFGFRPGHLEYRFTWGPKGTGRWFHRIGFQKWVSTNVRNPPEDNVKRLLETRPDCIYGRPFYLHLLSSLLASEADEQLDPILVLCTGEVMDPRMKEEISNGFNAPAVNQYGCAEHNFLASECPEERRLHLNMLNAVIEVAVDGEGAARGERGEVLITQLTNRAMPLIRYRLGDMAVISEDECSCGRHGDVLSIIQGRKDDMIKTRDGRQLPPELFTSTVTMPEIKGYMIVQERIDRIVIEIVSDGLDRGKQELIVNEFRRVMGDPDAEIDLVPVDVIHPDLSGKRRLVISRVTR